MRKAEGEVFMTGLVAATFCARANLVTVDERGRKPIYLLRIIFVSLNARPPRYSSEVWNATSNPNAFSPLIFDQRQIPVPR
jgi:hypothetical protein